MTDNTANKHSTVKTPCIGTCSTVFGDLVCRGCQRFSHEVIYWNTYSSPQKRLVLNRIDNIVSQVIGAKITVTDRQLLANKMQQLNISYREDLSPFCWIYSLLRAIKSTDVDIRIFGLKTKAAVTHLSHDALFKQINEECFCLSKAYYDTHITRAFRYAETAKIEPS